jgi:hypothetical protein
MRNFHLNMRNGIETIRFDLKRNRRTLGTWAMAMSLVIGQTLLRSGYLVLFYEENISPFFL